MATTSKRTGKSEEKEKNSPSSNEWEIFWKKKCFFSFQLSLFIVFISSYTFFLAFHWWWGLLSKRLNTHQQTSTIVPFRSVIKVPQYVAIQLCVWPSLGVSRILMTAARCANYITVFKMWLVRITSWYPNFNRSHFGLPPSDINRMTGLPPKVVWTTTLAKKIVTAEKFMRLIDGPIMWYRVISSFGSTATRLAVAARRELALQIEVDVARYHMIALRINLMNISAVTIFLARVVWHIRTDIRWDVYTKVSSTEPLESSTEIQRCDIHQSTDCHAGSSLLCTEPLESSMEIQRCNTHQSTDCHAGSSL